MKNLSGLKRDIIVFYRKNDRPVVDVILPEQDVTNGVIQFVVIESVLDRKAVTGNDYFSEKTLVDKLTIRKGESISATQLLDDVDWINNNPFLTAQPIFSPGETPYTTDLILKVDDRFPWRFYGGYENTGNELTGEDRYLMGFNWGNAFGLGHQFNYQFLIAEDFEQLSAHSFSYRIPFSNKGQLDLFGAYTNTEVEVAPFQTSGESYELGLRYTGRLAPIEEFTRKWYTGFGWKSSQNALEFGIVPASSTEVQLAQFEAGIKATRRVEGSILDMDLGVVQGVGGIFDNSDDSDFDGTRAGAESDYLYLQLQLNYIQQLPRNLVFDSQMQAQWSADRLLPSEQLNVGGYYSVRGYNEREFNQADSGFIWRNDLKFPALTFWDSEPYQTQAQFLVFTDFAIATSHGDQIIRDDGSSADSGLMWSVGLGARVTIADNLTVRADYGWQLRDAGSDDDGRFHLGVVASY